MSSPPTVSIPRPLRRDAEHNRQRIMAAAREVFAERGFGATLDDIAVHAGLGVGTVYRRFPNKAALIEALFEENFEEIAELGRRAAAVPDAWDGLVGFLTAVAEMQNRDRGLRDLMLTQRGGEARTARMRESMKPSLEALIHRALEQGELRSDFAPGDIPVIQLMVAAAFDFTCVSDLDGWRRYLALVLDGLRRRRDEPSELPRPALDDDGLDRALNGWMAGS